MGKKNTKQNATARFRHWAAWRKRFNSNYRAIRSMLTEMDGVWKYRREPTVVRALEKIGFKTETGIPSLAPELVLLFKNKNTSNHERPNDETGLEMTLPHLEAERRVWLYWALVATSLVHPWIKQLV